jgi:hypothetical protein
MNGWQPIETAPKDGSLVLLHIASRGFRLARWRTSYGDEAEPSWTDEAWKAIQYCPCDLGVPIFWTLPPEPPAPTEGE